MNVAEPVLKVQDKIDGFVVQRVTPLTNLRSIAYELLHPASGARILHLHNEDTENLFSVTFPTPPADDTGVPHILEHSVLAGSRKYQVKDPFFEMVKCSMATFINAMTGSDYTVYPVASNVRQDFLNLAEVYWDAVFHPLLTEKTFQREGHHLELADRDDPRSDLLIKGIVYNEMKGARSSPESKVHDLIEKNLWPDTPYGKDSGGDPDHIPELTWQGLRGFHENFYHPSNAFIFLYGDTPTVDHLKFLQPRLAEFTRKTVRADLPSQPRWTSPRNCSDVYPVAPTDAVDGKTFVVLNWLVGSATDVKEVFAFSALERILLGNQAAPLRKALIDSKLGEDLTSAGFWANGVDTSFHIGLKGTEADRAEAIQKLILDTLASVADEGVSRERFDAAMQQLAYHHLEIKPQFPLHLMGAANAMWMHGGDPLTMFYADQHLAELRRDFSQDDRLFSKLIRAKLLDNPHRLTLVVKPDQQIQARKDAQFAEKMRQTKAAMSPEQIQEIARNQKELEDLMNAPNPPEAIAALPQLKVSDLPPKPRHIRTTVETLENGPVLLHNDVLANGVNYLHLSFDLTGLPIDLYPYLSLFGDCVHKMGAAGQDYVAMAQRIAASTGGVGFSAGVGTRVDDPHRLLKAAAFTTKFLDDNAEAALGVLHDFIFELDPRDTPRLTDVVLQARSQQRMRPVHDGLQLGMRHAARGINTESFLQEITGGLPLIHLFEKLAIGPVDPLMERIDAIRKLMLNRHRLTASFTGTPRVYELVRKRLNEWAGAMSEAAVVDAAIPFERSAAPTREGLAAPMNVAYCSQVMPAPHVSHPDSALLAVGSRMLGLGYILDEVRFKGTAYGGGAAYNNAGQTMAFYSYRDPWINRTLYVYAGALKFVKSADWTQADVDRAIIGLAKDGERPIRPPQASGTALTRYLTGDTPERRDARHAALLSSSLTGVKRVLTQQLETNGPKSSVCVVSSREKLETANRERPTDVLSIEEILKSSDAGN